MLSEALRVMGEADHWSYFVSLYFTLQTVMTIGFGDEYVYSPAGALKWLKPFICLVLTAFLIAVTIVRVRILGGRDVIIQNLITS